jgi:predicted RNA-binding protein YlqC (UPF0109 family)
MENLNNLINTIVMSIVDNESRVSVSSSEEKGTLLYEIKVAKDDTGKLIGKQGRVATALRTIVKAAGAKAGVRVQVNVSKDPIAEQAVEVAEQAVEVAEQAVEVADKE